MTCFLAWYIVGLFGSLYWPTRYRENMRPDDWLHVMLQLPFYGLFGPFSILASFHV